MLEVTTLAPGNPAVPTYPAGGAANQFEIAAMSGMGGQIAPTPNGRVPMVYMGKDYESKAQQYYGSTTTAASSTAAARNQAMFSVDAAAKHMWSMTPQERKRLGDLSSRILGYDARAYWDAQSGKWSEAVMIAASEGGDVTPWDVLERAAVESVGSGGAGGGGGGGGGPSVVAQLTNPSDAQVIVDQALQSYLGRDASPKERDKFLKLLNQAEMENPRVATQTSTSGGLNSTQAAKEFAMSRKDAAEYMANTQYMDWLVDKVASDPTEGMASGL